MGVLAITAVLLISGIVEAFSFKGQDRYCSLCMVHIKWYNIHLQSESESAISALCDFADWCLVALRHDLRFDSCDI